MSYRDMMQSAVYNFVNDQTKRKADLVQLANERFAIPKGCAEHCTRDQLREKILQCLSNERAMHLIEEGN